ncbi:MAG: hypothetical protein ACRCV0_02550, partial [Brevinema sp.]
GHRVRESTSHIVCLRVNIMRIYLLLITVLILGACADKQTLSQTKSESIVAHYGIEPELFWLTKDSMKFVDDDSWIKQASTIYYEPISNNFYFASVEKTNGLVYDTNNIQNEKAFIEYDVCSYRDINGQLVLAKDLLQYIGSIDFYHRAYIDINGQQYLKTLSQIDTSFYVNAIDNTTHPIKGKLLPYLAIKRLYDSSIEEFVEIEEITLTNIYEDAFVFDKYDKGTLTKRYMPCDN